MNDKLVYLILLYNDVLETSCAYHSVCDKHIIVFDNTPSGKLQLENEKYAHKHQIKYFHPGKNVGNYQAYNFVFDYVSKKTNYDWLVILDSDSTIVGNYDFLDLTCDQACVYLPTVYSLEEQQVVFPRQYVNNEVIVGTHKVDVVTKLESINSGLVFNRQFFSKYYYDEKYFAYCGDFSLLQMVLTQKLAYQFIDITIRQHFFDHQTTFSDTTIKQLAIRLRDEARYLDHKAFRRFKYHFIIDKAIKFKQPRILKLLTVNFKDSYGDNVS